MCMCVRVSLRNCFLKKNIYDIIVTNNDNDLINCFVHHLPLDSPSNICMHFLLFFKVKVISRFFVFCFLTKDTF